MIDLDLIRKGSQLDDPTRIVDGAFAVAAVIIVPIFAFLTMLVLFLVVSLIMGIIEHRKVKKTPSYQSSDDGVPTAVLVTVSVVTFLALLATYAFAFHSWYVPRKNVGDEFNRAINIITESVEDTYSVNESYVTTSDRDPGSLGLDFNNVVAAVENDDPSELPLIDVQVANSTATYGVSFDNDTGEVELHNTAVFDNYPDPDTLLRKN